MSTLYRVGTKPHPIFEAQRRWFDTLAVLKDFLTEFDQIMNDNSKVQDKVSHFFVKIKPRDSAPAYYSTYQTSGLNVIDENTATRLKDLISKAKLDTAEDEEQNFEGIFIKIIHHSPYESANIFVGTNGDIKFRVCLAASRLFFTLKTRSSPELFKQLEEVAVYSKHVKQIPELEIKDEPEQEVSFNSIFNLQYKVNGKSKSKMSLFIEQY